MRVLSNAELACVAGGDDGDSGDTGCISDGGITACSNADGSVSVTDSATGMSITMSETSNGMISAINMTSNGVTVSVGIGPLSDSLGFTVTGNEAALGGTSQEIVNAINQNPAKASTYFHSVNFSSSPRFPRTRTLQP